MSALLVWLKKHWYCVTIISVLCVALLVRGIKFTEVPAGLTWDEAAIGYNGFAIWNTRRDEWLHRLPISFQSFGDYKAPLAIYLSSFFTAALGLSPFAVRLPFVLFGVAGVGGFILLVSELFSENAQHKKMSILGGMVLALSPWHIHFTRGAFESGLAVSFYIWGLFLLLRSLKVQKQKESILFAALASFSLLAALYTYHSSKVVIPLVLLIFAVVFRKRLTKAPKAVLVFCSTFLVGLIPLVYDSFWGAGLTRANVTFFGQLSASESLSKLISNLLLHVSPAFMVLGETTTLRHSDGVWGVLNPITYLLVMFFAVVFLGRLLNGGYRKVEQLDIIALVLTVSGLIPALITADVPHSNRALFAAIGFFLLALRGLQFLVELLRKNKLNTLYVGSHGEKDTILHAALGTLCAVYTFFFIGYQHNYHTAFAAAAVTDYPEKYIEAFQLAREYELGLNGRTKVEKIVFTSEYGQPYIFALFVRKTNPIAYHGGSLSTYHFTDPVTIADFQRPNALIVASGSDLDIPKERAIHTLYGADGSERFLFFLTNATQN